MTKRLVPTLALLVTLGVPARAHRLDEYLQAAILSLHKDRVQASLRLVPGVAVFPAVFASMDTNSDGALSQAERLAYAERVLRDLSVTLDGKHLEPRLSVVDFPTVDQMKQGLGEIHLEFTAELSSGPGNRKLVFENHHRSQISAYLVNCLVPRDPAIRIVAQNRNENQSFYELDYVQTGAAVSLPSRWWSRLRSSLGDLGGFPSMFRLGMRHIAEGTDHLLFLLVLLIPAPLLASRSRWRGCIPVRRSLLHILRVVTAFTVGHSITLALAALGFVRVPSRPVEVLIAVSILISAAHAVRPLFPGREAFIAAFFGLIHGLAFAATLGQLGLGTAARLVSILGFNLGIETMQLLVVAVILPSLLLLSRTSAYSVLRIGGSLFASFASMGWIGERLFGLHTSVDLIVDTVAAHAVPLAATLFLTSGSCWLLRMQGQLLYAPVQKLGNIDFVFGRTR